MDDRTPSGHSANVALRMNAQALDERNYGEVDIVLLHIEDARRRAEVACAALRAGGADDFLVEALERAQEQLSETAKLLTQGTFFAVPKQQLTLT